MAQTRLPHQGTLFVQKHQRPHDTFANVSNLIFSGQAWPIKRTLHPNETLAIQIPCGCSESESQVVVTYTVQLNDTPMMIANLLNSTLLTCRT